MATCKDCLHIEVCAYIKHDLPICSDFADRSLYVVREKGEWEEKPFLLGTTNVCSKCGEYYGMPHGKYNFCPNCGSDMRAEEQNRAREENDG